MLFPKSSRELYAVLADGGAHETFLSEHEYGSRDFHDSPLEAVRLQERLSLSVGHSRQTSYGVNEYVSF